MKKYLIAAGVTSLLIAAQAMASDAAGLIGARETAVAPAKAAWTASAPAAVAAAQFVVADQLAISADLTTGTPKDRPAPLTDKGVPPTPDQIRMGYRSNLPNPEYAAQLAEYQKASAECEDTPFRDKCRDRLDEPRQNVYVRGIGSTSLVGRTAIIAGGLGTGFLLLKVVEDEPKSP